MDLTSLKEQFKIKHNPIVMTLVIISFFLLVAAIINYITSSISSNETLMVIAIVIFSFVLSFWFVLFAIQYEKNSKEQLQYIYRKFAVSHNLKMNQAYQVLSVKDIPKDYLKKFPLFKFTSPRFSLFLKNQNNHHQLYFVGFYQSTGNSSYLKSSGLLYAYPIGTQIKPEDITKSINQKDLKYPLKTIQHRDQYMIYFEIKKQIPVFKKFSDKESDKVYNFAKDVFKFFDSMTAFFE
jgi:uncharacterized membrane protein (DUF485 family)